MKTPIALSAILLLICSLYSGIIYAHGHSGYYGGHHRGFYGHSGFGFYFGVPLYSYPRSYYSPPSYYSPYLNQPSYYYPPAVLTVPSTPPVYIHQDPPAVQSSSVPQYPPGYWYYCDNPEGYYPSVADCPQGWLQVNPIPSSPR